jgi:hypothetical protein
MQKSDSKIIEYLSGSNNGNTVLFKDNILWMVCCDIEFDNDTMNSLRFGAFKYGLYQRDHIPFILIKYGDLIFDFEINAFDLILGSQQRQFKSYTGKACFSLVSPDKFEVLAERQFHFNPHYLAHLKSCLHNQWKYYHNEFSVNKKIQELSEFLVNDEMFEASKLYTLPAINDIPVK